MYACKRERSRSFPSSRPSAASDPSSSRCSRPARPKSNGVSCARNQSLTRNPTSEIRNPLLCYKDIMTARLLLPVVATALVLASEWPQFRGPNASGVSNEVKLPLEFGPDQNVVWKTALPPGHSSPSVAGDRIYLTAVEQ